MPHGEMSYRVFSKSRLQGYIEEKGKLGSHFVIRFCCRPSSGKTVKNFLSLGGADMRSGHVCDD